MQIQGHYFAANTSQRDEALLLVSTDDNVVIKSASNPLLQNADMADIVISPRLGNTPRIISFLDGASFETTENNEIDHWLESNQSHNSLAWIHQLESKVIYVLMTLIFVVLFSWGFIQYGVPSISKVVANMLPTDVNQYLGKGSLSLLDKGYFSESELSLDRQNELVSLFNSYSKVDKDLTLNVIFRHGGKIGANAFALPDGHIVFTDEMVNLAVDDLELVAILGHELGHLSHRHLLRRVIQDSMLASLVVLITGDISYASSAIIALPVLLLELSYSRDFEQEADRFALAFLHNNNIPTMHFANIMLRLSKQDKEMGKLKNLRDDASKSKISDFLSTHPVTEERIKPFLIRESTQ